jgi:heme-degrading monooxygenase HmoA
MFIAMNRFRIVKGGEAEFERMWAARDTYLAEVPGFVAFHLLRGPEAEDHTLYASHTVWASERHFEDWTKSEAFRKAHAGAGGAKKDIYQGPPQFEGFEAVQEITRDAD